MKIQTECVPCLLKRIIFEAKLSTDDKTLQTNAIRTACKMLSEIYDPNECSAVIATKVHKMVYDTLNDEDPYAELKIDSNLIAKSLLPKMEALIKKSDDPLKTIMICSIIGNMMDFGIEGASTDPKMLKDIFEKIYSDGLGYDDYPKLKKLLKKAKRVILFTDNCGEIVFDKVLCRELKKFNPNSFITIVVRGKPIISDATLKDVQELNFKEVVDEILTTGCFAIGVDFNSLPPKLERAIKRADLIICKGMANYEAFSETKYRPIAYLLRTKCSAIANSMEISLDVNAIKVYNN
ncbi:MAG: DUF89 family protein [Thermoplasmatales archaeon]|nr:MAG: DUF89 family protein [Thermoplasmatales archaeon]